MEMWRELSLAGAMLHCTTGKIYFSQLQNYDGQKLEFCELVRVVRAEWEFSMNIHVVVIPKVVNSWAKSRHRLLL